MPDLAIRSGLNAAPPARGRNALLAPVLDGLIVKLKAARQLRHAADGPDCAFNSGHFKRNSAPEVFCTQYPSAIGRRTAGVYGLDMADTPAQRLKAARLAVGLSQLAAAAKLGIKYQTIQNWEKGIGFPKRTRLEQVAALYQVTPLHLLYGKSESNVRQLDPDTMLFAAAYQELDKAARARLLAAVLRVRKKSA